MVNGEDISKNLKDFYKEKLGVNVTEKQLKRISFNFRREIEAKGEHEALKIWKARDSLRKVNLKMLSPDSQ